MGSAPPMRMGATRLETPLATSTTYSAPPATLPSAPGWLRNVATYIVSAAANAENTRDATPRRMRDRFRLTAKPYTRKPSHTLQVLLRVVEDDPQRVPLTRKNPAHAVAEVAAITPARPLHRTMMTGESDRGALQQRNDHRPRLHPRPLLR